MGKDDYLYHLKSIGTKHGIIKSYIELGHIKDFQSFDNMFRDIHNNCQRRVKEWKFIYLNSEISVIHNVSKTGSKQNFTWEELIKKLWNETYQYECFKEDIEQLSLFKV